MISAGEIRRINVPTYLEVLGQLPNVSPDDIEATRGILQEALDDINPTIIQFTDNVDLWQAPIPKGAVRVIQSYQASGGKELNVPVVFDLSGKIYCRARNFEGALPASVVPYFVEGIFGAAEGDEITLKKVEGIRDLYRCAIRKGGVKNCGWLDGAQKLAEGERLETEKKRKTAATEELEAENLWRSAEEMREAARGWGDGDPDDIQSVMSRYSAYRYYNGQNDELKNAKVRREKAEAMMKEISEDDGGWPQFEKRYCRVVTTGHRDCSSGEIGSIDYYKYSCEFGVEKDGFSSGSCVRNNAQFDHYGR